MDGIIFDVDGTLWDSTDTVAESWNKAIRDGSNLDITIDGERLKTLFGKTMEQIYQALFPQLTDTEQKRIGDLCFQYENALLEEKPGTLYDGAAETIQMLSRRTNLYIVSNCQCGYIEILLRTCGLKDYFKDTLCYGQTLTSKGQTIRTLMERNNLNDVVYIGDTQGDADACKEAKIPFIFAAYGFGDVPEAETKIDSISELLNMEL
ncbi:HAD family hydrolase [Mediterraneibacter agrestimuris]|uniref:HAD family hydrolase n=1 Tax=Mediterraneibacter agrestimuris TaxID=2941333 RepID=UPI00203B9097|nr:HAD family hydrolase [Mediterraneibacter agrestimuris]